ncbi:GtrA family protein [Mycobacterium sp. BMJ-28]
MSFADATIARLPSSVRPFAERHHELIKFALVGATTFVIDSAIFYTLKLTVLEPKPVTAKIIAGIVAVIASYILNREWSFKDRGGRERHHEALLFFAVSGVGVLLSMAPLWVSSYMMGLRVPEVSLTVENIADFVSAYVIGNLLQMAFRFWAFRRFVFPDEHARNPDKALESTLTAGGIAEAFEDHHEHQGQAGQVGQSAQHSGPSGTVTPLRRSRRSAQLGDSSEPRVSKTS